MIGKSIRLLAILCIAGGVPYAWFSDTVSQFLRKRVAQVWPQRTEFTSAYSTPQVAARYIPPERPSRVNFPLQSTGETTASLDEVQEDLSGRGTGRKLPLSADLGLRMDTLIGNFTVSIAYLLDQGI